jgi:hypothetical protein
LILDIIDLDIITVVMLSGNPDNSVYYELTSHQKFSRDFDAILVKDGFFVAFSQKEKPLIANSNLQEYIKVTVEEFRKESLFHAFMTFYHFPFPRARPEGRRELSMVSPEFRANS